MINNIETARLILVPITAEIVKAYIDEKIDNNSDFKNDGSWTANDTLEILPIVYQRLIKELEPTGYELWMIIKKDTSFLIGDIGFHSQPNEKGEVEVGYGLIEKERRKGYGFEALNAIIKWAFNQDNVKKIKADCLIDNIPSRKILEKVGMKEIIRDDYFIYWELTNDRNR